MTDELIRALNKVLDLNIPTRPEEGPPPILNYNFSKFDELMRELNKWRDLDHEDTLTLHRNQIIELVEGVKWLRGCI